MSGSSTERMFPVSYGQTPRGTTVPPGPLSIPWSVAEKAYAVYRSRYGDYQGLEGLAERGGFHWSEMDEYHPTWREEASEIATLRARLQAVEHSSETWRSMHQAAEEQRNAANDEIHDLRARLQEVAAKLNAAENWRCIGEESPESDCRAGGATLEEMCAPCAAHEMTERAEKAERELARLKEREEHFAKALGVADGGRYRADWDGAISRVVKERDAATRRVAVLEGVLQTAKDTLTDMSVAVHASAPDVRRCFHCDEFMGLAVWPEHGNPNCVVGKTMQVIDAALGPEAKGSPPGEVKLRRLLWLRHDPDHAATLYGDDGEMQCSACLLDFKRMSPEEIEARWLEMCRAALAKKDPTHG